MVSLDSAHVAGVYIYQSTRNTLYGNRSHQLGLGFNFPPGPTAASRITTARGTTTTTA